MSWKKITWKNITAPTPKNKVWDENTERWVLDPDASAWRIPNKRDVDRAQAPVTVYRQTICKADRCFEFIKPSAEGVTPDFCERHQAIVDGAQADQEAARSM